MENYKEPKFKEAFDGLSDLKHVIKYENYFEIYDSHLSRFLEKEKIYLLEIGLLDGGSIDLWKRYFGDRLVFYGIDINPICKTYEDDNVNVFIGSQSDKDFLKSFVSLTPEFDIIIDDGGHTMNQQITSFEYLFKHVKEGGVYLCEDTHTSYWMPYGGGLNRKSSFIEFSKSIVDKIYFWQHSSGKEPDYLVENVKGIHFYDGIVVFDKNRVKRSSIVSKGTLSDNHQLYSKGKKSDLFFIYHKYVNKLCSFFGFKGYDYIFRN